MLVQVLGHRKLSYGKYALGQSTVVQEAGDGVLRSCQRQLLAATTVAQETRCAGTFISGRTSLHFTCGRIDLGRRTLPLCSTSSSMLTSHPRIYSTSSRQLSMHVTLSEPARA